MFMKHVNSWICVYMEAHNVMPLFLFLCHLCFLFGCSLLHLFFSLLLSLFVHMICVLFSLFTTPIYPPPTTPSLTVFGASFPSSPPTPPPPPPARVRGSGDYWTVRSCWMWMIWWRWGSQTGSVCIHTCRSSTEVWWQKAWLRPKTPPRVTSPSKFEAMVRDGVKLHQNQTLVLKE